ncbi:MAG TPA: hypothetical protein V6D27_01850 [Vampirovibrionales bacterium]
MSKVAANPAGLCQGFCILTKMEAEGFWTDRVQSFKNSPASKDWMQGKKRLKWLLGTGDDRL